MIILCNPFHIEYGDGNNFGDGSGDGDCFYDERSYPSESGEGRKFPLSYYTSQESGNGTSDYFETEESPATCGLDLLHELNKLCD